MYLQSFKQTPTNLAHVYLMFQLISMCVIIMCISRKSVRTFRVLEKGSGSSEHTGKYTYLEEVSVAGSLFKHCVIYRTVYCKTYYVSINMSTMSMFKWNLYYMCNLPYASLYTSYKFWVLHVLKSIIGCKWITSLNSNNVFGRIFWIQYGRFISHTMSTISL